MQKLRPAQPDHYDEDGDDDGDKDEEDNDNEDGDYNKDYDAIDEDKGRDDQHEYMTRMILY